MADLVYENVTKSYQLIKSGMTEMPDLQACTLRPSTCVTVNINQQAPGPMARVILGTQAHRGSELF